MIRNVLLCLLAVSAAQAAGPAAASKAGHIRAVEAALELRLGDIPLPAKLDGLVLLAPCRTCISSSFSFGAETALFWNGAPLSLAALRDLRTTKPDAAATVLYQRTTGRITRIIGYD